MIAFGFLWYIFDDVGWLIWTSVADVAMDVQWNWCLPRALPPQTAMMFDYQATKRGKESVSQDKLHITTGKLWIWNNITVEWNGLAGDLAVEK